MIRYNFDNFQYLLHVHILFLKDNKKLQLFSFKLPDSYICKISQVINETLRLLPPNPPPPQEGFQNVSTHTGQSVNWDMISDYVNQSSRAYRSPRSCRSRHDVFSNLQPSGASSAAGSMAGQLHRINYSSEGTGITNSVSNSTDRVLALAAMTARHHDKSPSKGNKVYIVLVIICYNRFQDIAL